MITDMRRLENGSLNKLAGKDIIYYLREKDPTFENIPVLVYSSIDGLKFAGFVNGIPLASATNYAFKVTDYILTLSGASLGNLLLMPGAKRGM